MPRRIVALATCNLNQWAMDFDGNLNRIKQSINEAKKLNSNYRVLQTNNLIFNLI